MNYSLPSNSLYGNEPIEIELPETWNVRVCSYHGARARPLTEDEIAERVRAVRLREAAAPGKTAVIIIDDMTRPTPCGKVVAPVIRELLAGGIRPEHISIIGATGMHRAMSREDFVRKQGEELTAAFPCYSHNPFFNTVQLGISSAGIPIELNAACVRADLKIGVGAVFGHPNTGVGGGGKLIVPGIASAETIRRYHLTPRERWNMSLQARQITIEAAQMLGLFCKFDALLNGSGEIAELFAGSAQDNLEQHLDTICRFFRCPTPEPADVVIANNYFKPSEPNIVLSYPEFYELLKPGGDLVVSANSPLGAATHYLFGKWGSGRIGGLAYYGESKLPDKVGRYFAFTQHPDRGTGLQYHFDPDDSRFHWSQTWDEIVKAIGNEPRDVLLLPYASVPFFDPPIEAGSRPTLYIGDRAFVEG